MICHHQKVDGAQLVTAFANSSLQLFDPRRDHRSRAGAGFAFVDGPQIGFEVRQVLRFVLESVVFRPVLDEEIEWIDHSHVRHQPDGDGHVVGALRKHDSGEEVSEHVLLPVDEVFGWLDLQRVSLDRGARVRSWAQPDLVWIDLHRAIE